MLRTTRFTCLASSLRGALACTLVAALACGDDAQSDPGPSASQRLAERIALAGGMLVDGDLPNPDVINIELSDLGPVDLWAPGESDVLGFELDDPEGREPVATLLQFDGTDSHHRADTDPDAEPDSSVVQQEVEISDAVCEGLCAGVIEVGARIAVELEDGSVSPSLHKTILVDCRELDAESDCAALEGVVVQAELSCQDVTQAEPAQTGDESLDALFYVAGAFAEAALATEELADTTLDELREALELEPDGDLAAEVSARIDAGTLDGISVLVGDLGCAVRAPRVFHMLRACDSSVLDEALELGCSGVCEPGASGETLCADALISGCRGFLEAEACGGACTGACTHQLEEPAACPGTCIGSCDGECPSGEEHACEGPCSGNCDGECRAASTGTCDGECTGLCAESLGALACDAPLSLYCTSAVDEQLTCPLDCYGEPLVEHGSALCRRTASAYGFVAARCAAPVYQPSFTLDPEASETEQEKLSQLVGDGYAPLTTLLALLNRFYVLERAGEELLAALDEADGTDDLSGSSQACAEDTLSELSSWLPDRAEALETLRAEIFEIVGPLPLRLEME